ncbi:unnamed protein product [Discula destructiva]
MSPIPAPTNSGIITDDTGARHIPESTRPDGSVRKAIKIRPGYKPAEDAVLYKNRTAESFRNRYKGGVIGAEEASSPSTGTTTTAAADTNASSGSSAAANKNAKRREARKKAAANSEKKENVSPTTGDPASQHLSEASSGANKDKEGEPPVDPEAEKKKKARNLTKKLKQAKELQDKKDGGQSLLPEQIAKVIKINELVRELAALGLDAEGEPLTAEDEMKAEGEVEPDGEAVPA